MIAIHANVTAQSAASVTYRLESYTPAGKGHGRPRTAHPARKPVRPHTNGSYIKHGRKR